MTDEPDSSRAAAAGDSDRAALQGNSDAEIVALIAAGRRSRRAALLILIERAHDKPTLVPDLATLAMDPRLRDDRLFHLVSMAWVAIIGLLNIETPVSRSYAEQAFAQLDSDDQKLLLDYLRVDDIQAAHPG